MTLIWGILHSVPYSNQPPVHDVIASLHAYFTCNLLIGFAILLSFKMFGGSPIECMTPLSFPGSWNDYAENYCFVSDTYYVPLHSAVEDLSAEERRSKRISYYQLMPFFLLFQAACFKFPTLIWKYLAGQSGIRVGGILRLATNEANSDPQVRADSIHSLAVHLQGALRFHSILKKRRLTPHKILRFINIKYSSYYVSAVYLLSKFAFLVNVVCQIYLLNRYLFYDRQHVIAYSVWRDLVSSPPGNDSWRESGLFPRVTQCDFEVREMGQSQNHSIQCVLLLNIFTERVFIILWAWYTLLSALTLCNLTSWLYTFLNGRSTEHFVFNHLEMSGERVFANSSERGLREVQLQVGRFINKYLRTDGIFLLRLIAQHADVVFTTDLIYRLWESHYQIEKQKESLRRTELQWQKHLARFRAIEGRIGESSDEADGDANNGGEKDFEAAADGPVRRTSKISFASPPDAHVRAALRGRRPSSTATARELLRHMNRRKSSLALLKRYKASPDFASNLRRTLSAESVLDSRRDRRGFDSSSDDDDEEYELANDLSFADLRRELMLQDARRQLFHWL